MGPSPVDAAARALATHLATLAAARADLERVRAALLSTPEEPGWWPFRTKTPPAPAEDRLVEAMRQRACLRDVVLRLEVDEASLRTLRDALAPAPRLPHDPDAREVAHALDEVLEAVLALCASATALGAVCDEAVKDLEAALADDDARGHREVARMLRPAEERVLRVVRDAADRAPLWSDRLDPVINGFSAAQPDSPERAAAEREIVAVLAEARARRSG